MQLFFQIARLSFQRQLTYRTANFAGLITNLFFGLLRASVMVALYQGRGVIEGISLPGAVTYTGITQAAIGYLSLFSWWEVIKSVYTGDIATDLLKPMNFYLYWLAQDTGRSLAQFLLRSVPLVAAYALVYPIEFPRLPWQWLALAAALALSSLVSFAWRFLVNLASFWTPDARGIGRFAFNGMLIFSGFVFPLRFFPEWFQRLSHLTPFPSLINTIIEVYLGVLTGPELAWALASQLAWFLALSGLSLLVLRAGVRRLVIQGG
jgi:ABC-2 type transport system permease protein